MHSRSNINRNKSKRRASRSSIASRSTTSGASSHTGVDDDFDISNNAFATAILTDDTSEESSSVMLRHELMESIMTHEVAVHDDNYNHKSDTAERSALKPPASPSRAASSASAAGGGGEVGRGLDPMSAPASMPMTMPMGGETRAVQNPNIGHVDDYSFRPNPTGVGSLPHHQEVVNDRFMMMNRSESASANSQHTRFSYSNPEVREEVQQYQEQQQQQQQYRRQQNQHYYQQNQHHYLQNQDRYQQKQDQYENTQRPSMQKRSSMSSIKSIGSRTGSMISSGLSSIKVHISEIDRMIMQHRESNHMGDGYHVPLPQMPYETRKACSIRTGIGLACLVIALVISISSANGQLGQASAEYLYKKFVLHGDSMPGGPNVINDETTRNGSHLFEKVLSYEKGFKPNREGEPSDHLPNVSIDNNGSIEVAVPHEMTRAHYIEFIWIKHVASDMVVLARNFDPDEDGVEPTLKAKVPSGVKLQAYLFCNQHKLWVGEEFQIP